MVHLDELTDSVNDNVLMVHFDERTDSVNGNVSISRVRFEQS